VNPYQKKSRDSLDLLRPLTAREVARILAPTLLCLLVAFALIMFGTKGFTGNPDFYSTFVKFAIYPSFPLAFAAAFYLRRRYGKTERDYSLMSKREKIETFLCGIVMLWPFMAGLAFRMCVDLNY